MQTVIICNGLAIWLETTVDCNMRGCRSVGLFILGQTRHFLGVSLLKKQVSPCLLRGSQAYTFSKLLINMQYVKSVNG